MSEYEPFCIYGFHVVCPATWKIELNPKSDRIEGDVVFKSPDKDRIFVSWGPLEKAKKKYSSPEEHANDTIRRIKKKGGVKEVELIRRKVIRVNSHETIFSHVKVVFSIPSLFPFGKAKTYEREVRCMHLYCESSGRYSILFGEITPDKTIQHGDIFESMIKSFICHKV